MVKNMTLETTVDEEVAIEFSRFPQEKQDQVRALVNYATLMGLNGKDLVSIGGKLDRVRTRREINANRAIVSGMDLRTIGKDKDFWTNNRWAWVDGQGTRYYFEDVSYGSVFITNTKTKQNLRCRYDSWKMPDTGRWSVRRNSCLPSIMMGVHHGLIKLP